MRSAGRQLHSTAQPRPSSPRSTRQSAVTWLTCWQGSQLTGSSSAPSSRPHGEPTAPNATGAKAPTGPASAGQQRPGGRPRVTGARRARAKSRDFGAGPYSPDVTSRYPPHCRHPQHSADHELGEELSACRDDEALEVVRVVGEEL